MLHSRVLINVLAWTIMEQIGLPAVLENSVKSLYFLVGNGFNMLSVDNIWIFLVSPQK